VRGSKSVLWLEKGAKMGESAPATGEQESAVSSAWDSRSRRAIMTVISLLFRNYGNPLRRSRQVHGQLVHIVQSYRKWIRTSYEAEMYGGALGGASVLHRSVSKVDMATLMPLIYKTVFSSVSTFETLPIAR
jgi:hypothetical protein